MAFDGGVHSFLRQKLEEEGRKFQPAYVRTATDAMNESRTRKTRRELEAKIDALPAEQKALFAQFLQLIGGA
jgi:hypothetical protein